MKSESSFDRFPGGGAGGGLLARSFVSELYRAGPAALPLVLLLAVSTGAVLAFQTGVELVRLDAAPLAARIVAISLARELAPGLTALILAGRVGAAMAAELAGMRVTEQVAAMEVLGVDVRTHLAAPRLIALMMATPALAVMFDVVALAAAAMTSSATAGLSPRLFLAEAAAASSGSDLVLGLVKATLFGAVLGAVACWAGLGTPEAGGQGAVGRSTARAVVWSTALVIVADWPLTRLLHGLLER